MQDIQTYRVSADDLFEQIRQLAAFVCEQAYGEESCSRTCIPMLHKLLVLTCHEGIRDTDQAYGNLFAQVDYLCRIHRLDVGDRMAVQTMRRHSNRMDDYTSEELMYDIRALVLFVSAVFGVGVPGAVASLIPPANRPYEKSAHIDYRYIRCVVRAWDEQTITATIDHEESASEVVVDYTADHLRYLKEMLCEGMQLNLLDCSSDDTQPVLSVRPSLIIVVKNTVTRIGKNTMQNKYTRFLRKFPHSRRAIFKILLGIIPSHFTLHTPHSTLHTSHLTP